MKDLVNENSVEQPWEGILAAMGFAIRATYLTTLKASPSQLVFGRDPILNIPFEANWEMIKRNKQKIIKQNNQRENSKRMLRTHNVGDKVTL